MEDENDVYEPGGAAVPEPETSQPAEIGHLGAGQAEFGQPDAGQADEDFPYAGQLDSGQLDAAESDADEFDADEFDAGEFNAAQLDTSEPDASEFDAAELDDSQPEVALAAADERAAAPASAAQLDAEQQEAMREIRLSVPRPETGEDRVDAALSMLDDLTELPVTDHPAVFEHVHAQLSEVLGELGGGQLTGRDGS